MLRYSQIVVTKHSDGQAISAKISGQGGRGVATFPLLILAIACLTFCLLSYYRPILGLSEYKLKVVNICEMHWTGDLEVVVFDRFGNM